MSKRGKELQDATEYITYFKERMDTTKSLWFVSDVLDVDAVEENAFSLAIGTELQDLVKVEEFLKAFPSVFLAIADCEKREIVASAMRDYLPDLQLLVPSENAFKGLGNAREVLEKFGRKAVNNIIFGAEELPVPGIIEISSLEIAMRYQEPSILSKIQELDSAIGGFYGGELSVWTGKRGCGKSTLIGQLVLEAVDQGHNVGMFSGELAASTLKSWMFQQAAGPQNVKKILDRFTGKTFDVPNPEIMPKVDAWWKNKIYIYDNKFSAKDNNIIKMFEYMSRRYGCAAFVVDNLMSVEFGNVWKGNIYQAQSEFTEKLKRFAKKNEVHVHLICHPRKTNEITADDISGHADITNKADNVFSLVRLDDKTRLQHGYQTEIRILKNRAFGEDIRIALDFDKNSRRFCSHAKGFMQKQYGWVKL